MTSQRLINTMAKRERMAKHTFDFDLSTPEVKRQWLATRSPRGFHDFLMELCEMSTSNEDASIGSLQDEFWSEVGDLVAALAIEVERKMGLLPAAELDTNSEDSLTA